MSAVHFGDIDAPLDMVFLHATGFNGQAYSQLLAPLAHEMDLHIAALDLRGHGHTDLPADPDALVNWHGISDDVCAFLKAYAPNPVVIAGHSFGAVVSFLVAKSAPQNIRALVSFDPVTMPPVSRLMLSTKAGRESAKKRFPLARNAGRRRAHFDSFDAAFERYKGRGTFKGVPDAVLRDYISGGFKTANTGGVELTCAPAWEQATFVSQGHSIFKAAKSAPDYRKVIYAGKFTPSWPATRAYMKSVIGRNNVEFHKERAHFFPFHDDQFTRGFLKDALKSSCKSSSESTPSPKPNGP